MPRVNLIQLRGGVATAWTSANPVLAGREPGLETDTIKIKFGDGVTAWNDLPYMETGGGELVNIDGGTPTSVYNTVPILDGEGV